MPGKVNPVIAESLLMVCAQVIGYDATIAWCGAAGNFELNTMMPILAYDLLESIQLLAAATRNFAEKLVDGLEADRERIAALVGKFARNGDGARACHRLRQSHRHRERGLSIPAIGARGRQGEERVARRSVKQSARSRPPGRRLIFDSRIIRSCYDWARNAQRPRLSRKPEDLPAHPQHQRRPGASA